MNYEDREQLKSEGWVYFANSTGVGGKVSALMHFIIKAHYWRAREHIESLPNCKFWLRKIFRKKYSPGYEMDIDHYTEHWLFAHKDVEFMQDGVLEGCSEWYEPKESKYLPPMCSVYQIGEVNASK